MRCIYKGFDLGMLKLHSLDITGEFDPTGKDLLYHSVVMTVEGTINPFMTATGKDTLTLPAGGYGVEGDRAGITIDRLTNILQNPRQSLKVFVGPDLIYDVPGEDDVSGNAGTFSCDPAGGPITEDLRFFENTGDKTCKFHWRVRFAVSECGKYLLSNRWSAEASIDKDQMTTRTLRGRAIFRLDYLTAEGLTADSFRKFFVAPVAPGMRRYGIAVDQNEDGSQVSYTVTDTQFNYGLGPLGADITRIEGSIAVSARSPLDGVNGIGSAVSAVASTAAAGAISSDFGSWALRWGGALFMPGGGLGLSGLAPPMAAMMTGVAQNATAHAIVRVFAAPYNDSPPAEQELSRMSKIGLSVMYDRLSPLGVPGTPGLPMLRCHVTQGLASDEAPFIEVRGEFLCANTVALKAILSPESVPGLMNMSSTFVLFPSGARIVVGRDTPGPSLPVSNGTRGNWIGALVAAALKANTCTLPQVPAPFGPVEEPSANM